jgi:surface antigen
MVTPPITHHCSSPLHGRRLASVLVGLAVIAGTLPASSSAAHRPPRHASISTRGRHPVRHSAKVGVGHGSGAARNPYTHGGCTFWAWANRSDLPGGLGDAWHWALGATRAGFPVDGKPEVGAIAVYQPGVYGAHSTGHVAVVTQIAGSRILISEASFDPRLPDYGDHEIYHRWTGIVHVQFIHHKPQPPTPPVSQSPPDLQQEPAHQQPTATPPQPANLLRNPGFESVPGAPGWFRNNLAAGVNEQVYSDAGRAHGGTWFFETNTKQPGGSIAQDLPIAPGPDERYQSSIWLRSPSGQPFTACPTIWALGTTNTPAQTCATVDGAWQQVTTTLVIPHGTPAGQYSKLRVEVYETTTVLNLDLDDASLTETDRAPRPGPQ